MEDFMNLHVIPAQGQANNLCIICFNICAAEANMVNNILDETPTFFVKRTYLN